MASSVFFQALFSCLRKQRRQSAKGSDGKLPNTYMCCAWKVRVDWEVLENIDVSFSKQNGKSEISGTKFPLPDDPSDSDFHRSMEAAECHVFVTLQPWCNRQRWHGCAMDLAEYTDN